MISRLPSICLHLNANVSPKVLHFVIRRIPRTVAVQMVFQTCEAPIAVLTALESAFPKESTLDFSSVSNVPRAEVDEALLARACGFLHEHLQALERTAQTQPNLTSGPRELRKICKPSASLLPLPLVSLCCDVQMVGMPGSNLGPLQKGGVAEHSVAQHCCWLQESDLHPSRLMWDRYGCDKITNLCLSCG
jgi:hypothetical protein